MQNKIKAIFFDIDGTTYLHKDHCVPESTLYSLKQLKNKGIKLALCTSRVKGEMIHLPKEFVSLFDGIISCNGALIEENNQIIKEQFINENDAKRILTWCRENNVVVRWATSQMDCYFDYHQQEDITEFFYYLYLMRPTVKPHTDEKLVHLLFYPQKEDLPKISALLENRSHLTVLRISAEITAENVSKASALTYLSQRWNINLENTMAFGDGNNDICILETAGIGVAMGQASPTVKEAADYVTTSIEDNGIYNALKTFNLID